MIVKELKVELTKRGLETKGPSYHKGMHALLSF